MTGRITDINKIAVRLMGFSYKKNCGRLPFGKFLPQFFFAFLFRQNPSASFLFLRTVPFLQIGKCIVLMVSEFSLSLCLCSSSCMEHAEDAGLLDQLGQAVENDGIDRPHDQVL